MTGFRSHGSLYSGRYKPEVPKPVYSGPPLPALGNIPCSPCARVHMPRLFLWAQVMFMTQTVHTPLVSEENSTALNLISCNSTHFVIACKENATVLKQIFSAILYILPCVFTVCDT